MAAPRILVVAPGHIGDSLAATPVVRALRRRYPRARLSVLVLDTVASLWAEHPDIDAVITVPDRRHGGPRGVLERLPVLLRLLPRLRGRFDRVVVLQAGGGAAVVALLTGALVREGVGRGWSSRLLTRALPALSWQPPRERNLELLRLMGLETAEPRLWMPTAPDGAAALLRRLGVAGDGPLIGLHPGSDWGCQMWGAGRWASAGDDLARRWGARLIITGTAGERWFAERIAAQMSTVPLIACGLTTLPELAALIGRLDLLVGVESGPVALAVAAGTPVVALEGLYYRDEQPPWGRLPGDEAVVQIIERDAGDHRWFGDCRQQKLRRERGCVNPACIGHGVMGEIRPAAVVAAGASLLTRRRGAMAGNP